MSQKMIGSMEIIEITNGAYRMQVVPALGGQVISLEKNGVEALNVPYDPELFVEKSPGKAGFTADFGSRASTARATAKTNRTGGSSRAKILPATGSPVEPSNPVLFCSRRRRKAAIPPARQTRDSSDCFFIAEILSDRVKIKSFHVSHYSTPAWLCPC